MDDEEFLNKEFNFEHSIRNPYYEKLTAEVTMRLGKDVIAYYEKIAEERKMSFNRVIDMYLSSCMLMEYEPHFPWEDEVSE